MQQPADENDADGIARNLLIPSRNVRSRCYEKRTEAEAVSLLRKN